jgi:5'-nucleotidase
MSLCLSLFTGGHDHDYDVRKVNDKYIIKSGTDFRTFSKIDLIFPNANDAGSSKVEVAIREVQVTSADFDEDEELKQELEKYSQVIDSKMDVVLGQFSCDLDGE